jgi:hypothetical protein
MMMHQGEGRGAETGARGMGEGAVRGGAGFATLQAGRGIVREGGLERVSVQHAQLDFRGRVKNVQ